MKVMTFNLKNDTFFTRKNMRWDTRREFVLNIIETYRPDVIGVQELTPEGKKELSRLLPQYQFIGEPRNARLPYFNEETDIGFLKKKYECLEENTFWLSAHPQKRGSRVWTSIFPRICTKALLKEKTSGKTFLVYNTHLDHLIPHSRLKELQVIAQSIQKKRSLGTPVILMGDFNTTIDSAALKDFLASGQSLQSVYTSLSLPLHNTIHYGRGTQKENVKPIDYIFVSRSFEIQSCEIITAHFNGFYPSDHYPVIAELQFPKSAGE